MRNLRQQIRQIVKEELRRNVINENNNIKISSDGYVKLIKHPMTGKMVKDVMVNGIRYRYNSAYKTYNSIVDNTLLYKSDISNIRYI